MMTEPNPELPVFLAAPPNYRQVVSSAVDQNDAPALESVLATGGCSELCVHEALMKCTSRGLTECVRMLLRHGADCNHIDSFTNTPLILASEGGHGDIIDLLLESNCEVNSVDIETRTALHWASLNGHLAIVERLLAHGATSSKDKIYGFTPLMLAARQGHAGVIELLLAHTNDVNKTDIHGETALFDAARNNNVDCVRLLIQNGADINHRENENRTPLLVAVMWNRPTIVVLLVDANCELDVPAVLSYFMRYRMPNETSRTPLEAAVLKGYYDVCQILVMAGSDVNVLLNFTRSDIMLSLTTSMEAVVDPDHDYGHWLDSVSQPRSLKQISRIAVRKHLGPVHKKDLKTLRLPDVLHNYLLLPELAPFR